MFDGFKTSWSADFRFVEYGRKWGWGEGVDSVDCERGACFSAQFQRCNGDFREKSRNFIRAIYCIINKKN